MSVFCITGIIVYQYDIPATGTEFGSWGKDVFEVRGGYIESLGTFVFAFVSQHT